MMIKPLIWLHIGAIKYVFNVGDESMCFYFRNFICDNASVWIHRSHHSAVYVRIAFKTPNSSDVYVRDYLFSRWVKTADTPSKA